MELQHLLDSGEIKAILLLDPGVQYTKRELDLIQQAFHHGMKLGEQSALPIRSCLKGDGTICDGHCDIPSCHTRLHIAMLHSERMRDPDRPRRL